MDRRECLKSVLGVLGVTAMAGPSVSGQQPFKRKLFLGGDVLRTVQASVLPPVYAESWTGGRWGEGEWRASTWRYNHSCAGECVLGVCGLEAIMIDGNGEQAFERSAGSMCEQWASDCVWNSINFMKAKLIWNITGQHGAAFTRLWQNAYRNVYRRPCSAGRDKTGFRTTRESRALVMDQLKDAVLGGRVHVRSQLVADDFAKVYVEDGAIRGVSDRLMALALAVHAQEPDDRLIRECYIDTWYSYQPRHWKGSLQ